MGESRGQMEARLKREGRWDVFEARRKALKAEGMTGSEAYEQVIAEFAEPLARTDGNGDRVPAETFQGKSVSTREIIRCVARNIAISDVKPEVAPSSDAWAMLRWVQRAEANESVFWRLIFPKLLSSQSKMEADEGDGSSLVEEVDDDNTDDPDELIDECLRTKKKAEQEVAEAEQETTLGVEG